MWFQFNRSSILDLVGKVFAFFTPTPKKIKQQFIHKFTVYFDIPNLSSWKEQNMIKLGNLCGLTYINVEKTLQKFRIDRYKNVKKNEKIIFKPVLNEVLRLNFSQLYNVVLPIMLKEERSIRWRIKSTYPYIVNLKFYSQDEKGRQWPNEGKHYVLKDSNEHVLTISGLRGEKVCYGAWTTNNKYYWGVGKDDKHGCKNCCYQCKGIETRLITL